MVILKPSPLLSIPKVDTRLFQIQVAITMDHIWFMRNWLVHDHIHPNLDQISNSVKAHKVAWNDATFNSISSPSLLGNFNANFDVAVESDFLVLAMVLSDSNGKIIHVATKHLMPLIVKLKLCY
jgi:hypothetical protein